MGLDKSYIFYTTKLQSELKRFGEMKRDSGDTDNIVARNDSFATVFRPAVEPAIIIFFHDVNNLIFEQFQFVISVFIVLVQRFH